jgi:hypothetical protein
MFSIFRLSASPWRGGVIVVQRVVAFLRSRKKTNCPFFADPPAGEAFQGCAASS